MGDSALSPNFAFLAEHDRGLAVLGTLAERSFHRDPVATLMRLRQLCEALAEEAAAHAGFYVDEREDQLNRLRRLSDARVLPREVADVFHSIRKLGNAAVHDGLGDAGAALHALKRTRALSVWFHQTFGSDRGFKPGAFVPPLPPQDATAVLREQLAMLKARLAQSEAAQEAARLEAEEARRTALGAAERANEEEAENAVLEELLDEAAKREAEMVDRLRALQARATETSAVELQAVVERAEEAGSDLELDEADTRALIDEQLREAGWEADTQELSWGKGVRPAKNRNLAIAEWPTDDGPADYLLFLGLQAVAVVEAKRQRKDVAAAIEQSKRYSRAYLPKADDTPPEGTPWGPYRIPFLFATNGRPYLKQLSTKSGTWFLDARRPDNHPHPLDGWYTPDGLKQLLRVDVDRAQAELQQESTDYLGLREYQVRAIKAVERGLEEGKREMLLAMATGTGKTRTCIGLCYRLIKTKRFRRILFLVDRTALGVQAANAFKDARLENLRTFAEAYDLKELGDATPETDTRLQIATVQSLVRRILYVDDGTPPPQVDQYDCIVVDESHRGYLLDREMSDRELNFRSETDYISKYRRVLEHFDAVKVGLTATPALHTTEIFGPPVFEYGYREAVIDGYLIDHEPPTRIVTELAEDGIHWRVGEKVEAYHPTTGEVQLSLLPDDVDVEIEHFNKRVVTEHFNRAVCGELARHIDPSLDGKTLIFCATDLHADMAVQLLKEAFAAQYGSVDDDAVLKITGSSDKPLELIRRYKNERLPNVAVTVDLLTTGIDVPPICNIVFLRRVRSRILYEQMLGRATRRCDGIGKEVFRIFDAVDLYSALDAYTAMKPVVVNPTIGFAALIDELGKLPSDDDRAEVVAQIVAKLQRKKRKLGKQALEQFEAAAGMGPDDVLRLLRDEGPEAAQKWFVEHASLGVVLDSARTGGGQPILISEHEDKVRRVEQGFGDNSPPGDYIEEFRQYVKENLNKLPALIAVTQRPRELSRKGLKELKLAFDQAGYSETRLRSAWRAQTNEDIAASIVGYIRQAALGDPLRPYDERVQVAMKKILASQPWTAPQRKWLERIGKQLTQETVVDREVLDRGQFAAQGGFERLNKVFDGRLEQILGDVNEALWEGQG
ncbi:MAG: type I restriction-modification system endonuclease [Myxococcales bacterium]|nr:type I restriction-modification system endonuclease [Myxococcales bacterium]